MICYNRKGETHLRIKKIKYILFTLVCVFITPLVTRAECNYQRQAELSRLASNVQFSYTYDITTGVDFTLYMTNLTDDIYIVDEFGNVFNGAGEKSKLYSSNTVSGFQQGNQVRFEIYSNDNECKNYLIMNKYVNFPKFNIYSTLDECKQHPSFKYCQIWADTASINYDQFINELNVSLNTTKTIREEAEENIWEEIFNFFKQPHILIVGSILILLLLSVVVWKIIRRKRR